MRLPHLSTLKTPWHTPEPLWKSSKPELYLWRARYFVAKAGAMLRVRSYPARNPLLLLRNTNRVRAENRTKIDVETSQKKIPWRSEP